MQLALEVALLAIVGELVVIGVLAMAMRQRGLALAKSEADYRRALLDLAQAKDAADVKGETVEDLASELRRRGILGDSRIPPSPLPSR